MSGIIGHTMYAILAAKAAREKKLTIAPLVRRHWSSYLAASYLGSDIQTLPEAICVDTGEEVGYGQIAGRPPAVRKESALQQDTGKNQG